MCVCGDGEMNKRLSKLELPLKDTPNWFISVVKVKRKRVIRVDYCLVDGGSRMRSHTTAR